MSKIGPYNRKNAISEAPQVEELLRNLEFHKTMQRITGRIRSAGTPGEILLDIREDIRKLFRIRLLTIYLIDRGKKELFTLEDDGGKAREVRLPLDYTTFAGYAALKKKMLHIADAYNQREIRRISDTLSFDDSLDEATGVATGQILATPIIHDGVVLGVMEIRNKKGGDIIDEYDQIFLDEIEVCLARAFFMQLEFGKIGHKAAEKFRKLIQDGIVTQAQLDQALKEAYEARTDPATVLLEKYRIAKKDIGAALADHYGCPFTPYSDDLSVVHGLLTGIDRAALAVGLWIPLKVLRGRIHVLAADPSNTALRREVEEAMETHLIQYEVGLPADILRLIERSYAELEEKTHRRTATGPAAAPARPVAEKKAQPISTLSGPAPKEPLRKTIPPAQAETKGPVRGEEASVNESHPVPPQQKTDAPDGTKTAPAAAAPATADPQPPVAREGAKAASAPPPPAAAIPSADAVYPPLAELLDEAVARRASAIHFEPDAGARRTAVRFRIDGECLMHAPLPPGDYEKILPAIKKMAGLDGQTRTAIQNGKAVCTRPSGDEISLRVAVIPTRTGLEDSVLHLSARSSFLSLELLGLSEENYDDLSNILRQPRGVVFVAAPAGGGVTTTLHACLAHINSPDKKIWTAEEAIEIPQDGLRQVVVDPQKGLDYPSVLRSILNADPDVVMLGRIPDRETAGLCMEASVRGRLVLSSLRTESIAETLARLPDMGLDNLLFADAMLAIVEQRLLKILCPHCREKYHPGREEYDDLAQTFGPESFASLDIPYTDRFTLFRPRGCDACGQTGYKGRTCVSEIFIFTPQIKRMIRRKESPDAMYQTALAGGMTPLLQDGLSRVLEGFCDFRHARLSCLKEPAGFR